jgi:heat shock protein 5
MKRLIGGKWDDPEVQRDAKLYPFKVINSGGKPLVEVLVKGEAKRFAPEEISAMVLGKMKVIAEEYLGRPVKVILSYLPCSLSLLCFICKNAVVTCPGLFL